MTANIVDKKQAVAAEPASARSRYAARSIGALPPAALSEVFGHLDGTTLTRASGVCRAWWQAARDDRLWRELCFRERYQWVGAAAQSKAAPRWAIERPKGPECLEPPRSWLQAYRLLAMVEHGRPYGGLTPPSVVVDETIGAPPRWHAQATSEWCSPHEVQTRLASPFSRWPRFQWALFAEMRTNRRQLTQREGFAAIRDATGDVLLLWHEQGEARFWHLPLRKGGYLAGEVRLFPRSPGDEAGVGDAHVLTRSGHRWRRWQYGQLAPAAVLPGRKGDFVRVQDRRYWLSADDPDTTYSRLSLCDFATGAILQSYSDNHIQVAATLLTELGPLVGWVAGGWQARILWSSRVELLAPDLRPENLLEGWRRHGLRFGNRPQRIDTDALPRNARILDTALSEEVPGRVLLWWFDASAAPSSSRIASGYVDGWGQT